MRTKEIRFRLVRFDHWRETSRIWKFAFRSWSKYNVLKINNLVLGKLHLNKKATNNYENLEQHIKQSEYKARSNELTV